MPPARHTGSAIALPPHTPAWCAPAPVLLEDKLAPCLRAIIERQAFTLLTSDERVGLAVLVAVQHLRTRAFRESIRDAARVMTATLDGVDLSAEEPAKRLQIHFMSTALGGFVDALLRMKWILMLNETEVPFWCSDNPLTNFNERRYDPLVR